MTNPDIHIEVQTKIGTMKADPNMMLFLTLNFIWENMVTICFTESDISGEPAVIIRDDVELKLTPEEAQRLFMKNLKADEYFTLRKKFGLFYMIHEDFYDPETGKALQDV